MEKKEITVTFTITTSSERSLEDIQKNAHEMFEQLEYLFPVMNIEVKLTNK